MPNRHNRMRRFLFSLIAAAFMFLPAAVASAALEFPDRLKLVAMLRSGDFAALEQRLTAYQEGFERGEVPEDWVDQAFLAFGNSDPALESILTRWTLLMPDSYAAPLARGVYYWRLGWHSRGSSLARRTPELRFAEMRDYFAVAVADLRLAIELNRKLSVAYANLINIGMASGRLVSERDVMEQGLREIPRSAVIRYRYLYSLTPWWGGSLSEIWTFVERMKREFPDAPELKHLEGFYDLATAEALRRDGKREEAVAYYDRAIGYGVHWWFHYMRGMNFFYLKKFDNAVADFSTSLQIRPGATSALEYRATVFRKVKRYERALADLDFALMYDSHDPEVLRERAVSLRFLKRYREAVRDLTNALVYAAYDARVHYDRGYIYLYKLNEKKKALIDMKRATLLKPKRAKYWYGYASALFRNIDCDFIAAAATYVRLCKAGSKCQENQLVWAERALQHFSTDKECSVR